MSANKQKKTNLQTDRQKTIIIISAKRKYLNYLLYKKKQDSQNQQLKPKFFNVKNVKLNVKNRTHYKEKTSKRNVKPLQLLKIH